MAALFGIEAIDEATTPRGLADELAESPRTSSPRTIEESRRGSTRKSSRRPLEEATGEELVEALEEAAADELDEDRREAEADAASARDGYRPGRHRRAARRSVPVTPSANSGPPGHRPARPVVTVG